MENFVLNGNGQIDINRRGMDDGYRFRLQEINHNTEICSNRDGCDDTATSVSSYSNYKQRIDAMFDDSRSILSDKSRSDRRKLPGSQPDPEVRGERVIANNIQEKIEKMFEELSGNSVQRQDWSRGESCERGGSSGAKQDFPVTYLGSKPLADKNVSLVSLQDPLKELYFEHKRNPSGREANVLTISKEGLKIKMSEKEELNPFQTIAVWASVKLSFRVAANGTEYAFLPLVTDPDGIDKNLLFRQLTAEDKQNFHERIGEDSQSPIFAVVMKNVSKNKQLECHGFVCQSSEDAIVIAANLYQVLMKKLKRKKEQKEQKSKKDECKEGVEVLQAEESRTKPKVKVKKQAPPVPERTPKAAESKEVPVTASEISEAGRGEESPAKEESGRKVGQRRGSVPTTGTEPVRTLRRTVSERGGSSIRVESQEGGDILTKVAIPRSSSFLNANGPLSRFSGRGKTSAKNEIVSPLGFKELFNEFRLHEGLESMDDILNAIIDAEGMSFNDLKPIYKEFLLKLAVTLTKDELYQRSKIIMRRQKKKNKKCSLRKKAFMSSIGLHKIFRKTANRLGKSEVQKPTNLEFTSIVFQSTGKQFESNVTKVKQRRSNSFRVKRRQSSRRRVAKRLEVKSKHVSTTSEDSDFFQPKRNTSDSGGGPNRSSSGYFSCSECSCDSEKCTCTRTDKCYCTMGLKKSYNASSSDESRVLTKKKSSFRFVPEPTTDLDPEDSLKSCSCDTESCGDSGKCYCTQTDGKRTHKKNVFHLSDVKAVCQTPHLHQKEKLRGDGCPSYRTTCRKHGGIVLDQLKEQWFSGSESNLSRAASPATAWESNERNLTQRGRLRAAGSCEFLNGRLKPHQVQCQRYPHFEEHLLKEIQNTSQRRAFGGAPEVCVRGPDVRLMRPGCGMRPYSSMRCRSEVLHDGFQQPLQRSISYRTKSIFSSVRSKHNCDSIMNHIKFPNHANSSLRFTQRMDVYNSFSENRPRHFQKDDFLCRSHHKENRAFHEVFLPNESEGFPFHRENFKRLDLFSVPKSQGRDSVINRKKVLVVSARDPKGKVLYMGTSSRCGSSCKNLQNFNENARKNGSEALAVKKSAEIAALLSDVTSKHKLSHLDYVKNQKQSNYRQRSNSYRATNLENTLGYLP